mmetsp:Transcript_17793/g.43924  ORF Transcript_17793/g.43924 Transcript_17793/m.43924 type:complete len:82 (-) Transcript_17793:2410-2655(-)
MCTPSTMQPAICTVTANNQSSHTHQSIHQAGSNSSHTIILFIHSSYSFIHSLPINIHHSSSYSFIPCQIIPLANPFQSSSD